MPTATPYVLFREFLRMALGGFGGVLPVARHAIVERNRWLDDREFAELLSVGQVFPGANIVNLSVMLGWRMAGWRGSLAAISGLVFVPAIFTTLLGSLYIEFSVYPTVRASVHGMAIVAAGLVLATALKLARSQPRNLRNLALGLAAFGMQGLLHLPLALIGALLVPLALLLEWHSSRS